MRLIALLLLTVLLVGCAQSDGDKDWAAEGRVLGQQLSGTGTPRSADACREAVMRYVDDNDAPQSPANRGVMRQACQAV